MLEKAEIEKQIKTLNIDSATFSDVKEGERGRAGQPGWYQPCLLAWL